MPLYDITNGQNPRGPGFMEFGVEGDAVPPFRVSSDGVISWGDGSSAHDVSLSRSAAGVLNVTGTDFQVNGSPVGGGGDDSVYPLAGYGLLAAAGDPIGWMAVSSYGNNTLFYTRVWIPAGVAITSLWVAVRDAGTWDGATGPNGIGLFTDAGVYVDDTAAGGTDGTMWTAAGWRGGALAAPVAAQGSGRFVYLAPLARGQTASPNIPYPSSCTDSQTPWFDSGIGVTKRRCTFQGGQTTFPASFDPTSTGTATTFLPLVGVS